MKTTSEMQKRLRVIGGPANTNAAFEDTMPLCPVCGTPALPGRVGGFMCLTKSGKMREPHAARVKAWAAQLATR
jgi:hypothetical protein